MKNTGFRNILLGNVTKYTNVKQTHELKLMVSTQMCVLMHTKSLQSCPTLCDPMNCSPPVFSVHGILYPRIASNS